MQDENKNKKSFRQGMKSELKKVIWPTGKQVVKSTFATISFVLLISVILIALDYVFLSMNTKWVDLVLGSDEKQQVEEKVNNSGDKILEDVVISGDAINTEIASGENDANVNSGEENNVTE